MRTLAWQITTVEDVITAAILDLFKCCRYRQAPISDASGMPLVRLNTVHTITGLRKWFRKGADPCTNI